MSKVTHDDLIKIVQALDLEITDEGMCKGFASMLAQSILAEHAGKKGFQSSLAKSFFKRLDLIFFLSFTDRE